MEIAARNKIWVRIGGLWLTAQWEKLFKMVDIERGYYQNTE